MGVASAISGGLGLAGGIYQAINGAKEQREAKDALDNYQRQELNNVADGLQVSTLGSDLQREEQARLSSGQIQALQDSGVRGILGGIGRVNAQSNKVYAQTGADLDMQQKQIDQMRAEDEARIRGMQENREQNDINALSSQYQAGKQDQNMAFGNIIQGTGMLGGAIGQFGQNQPAFNSGGYSVSGNPTNLQNGFYQSPVSERYNTPNTFGNYGNWGKRENNGSLDWQNNIPNAKYF